MRLDAAIRDGTERLRASCESARLDTEVLLCLSIDMPRSYLFAHPEDELDAMAAERFLHMLGRRASGEPLAYITGKQEFWSRELMVTPATLIPRPETELLVELALSEIPVAAQCEILDLGTGSGAIAIAIAGERPASNITAIDVSEEALGVARENIRVSDMANVACLAGDWTEPVRGQRFDVIVSNPPYVRDGHAALQQLGFEPASALVSGADGLEDIRRLATECTAVLARDGVLLMEHGAEQRAAVEAILGDGGWSDISCHNDLAGHPRVTLGRRDGRTAHP